MCRHSVVSRQYRTDSCEGNVARLTWLVSHQQTIRAQDARSPPAIQALQQWQFLPAQLDGRRVASKVLIGVTVTVE
jgi:hypothetical protein